MPSHREAPASKHVPVKKPTNPKDPKTKKTQAFYLTQDPATRLFKDRYRVRNLAELKEISVKGTNVSTLAWQTSLRPNLGLTAALQTNLYEQRGRRANTALANTRMRR